MDDFFLVSTELRDYHEKHRCKPIDPIDGNKLMIQISPPIPSYVYHSAPEELEYAVLAPRYGDQQLWPEFSEWPFRANFCIPKAGGTWEEGPWDLIDIVSLTKE